MRSREQHHANQNESKDQHEETIPARVQIAPENDPLEPTTDSNEADEALDKFVDSAITLSPPESPSPSNKSRRVRMY